MCHFTALYLLSLLNSFLSFSSFPSHPLHALIPVRSFLAGLFLTSSISYWSLKPRCRHVFLMAGLMYTKSWILELPNKIGSLMQISQDMYIYVFQIFIYFEIPIKKIISWSKAQKVQFSLSEMRMKSLKKNKKKKPFSLIFLQMLFRGGWYFMQHWSLFLHKQQIQHNVQSHMTSPVIICVIFLEKNMRKGKGRISLIAGGEHLRCLQVLLPFWLKKKHNLPISRCRVWNEAQAT